MCYELSGWPPVSSLELGGIRHDSLLAVKIPKPTSSPDDAELHGLNDAGSDVPLPQTLIRIPVQQTKPSGT